MTRAQVHRTHRWVARDQPAGWHAADRDADLIRLGLALGLFVLSVLAVQRDRLSLLERDVFLLVNDLPPWLLFPMQVVMQLGTRFAPLVIGGLVAVGLRRVRLGVSIAVAGTGAWLLAQGLKLVIERARPAEFLTALPRELSSGGPGFVSGHTAVATAMAAVTAPYLPRPWRRVVWGLVVAVGFARIYSGVHLPLDVVGGFAVGWFTGTLVHLVIGVPPPRRTPESVSLMLGRLGLDVVSVEPAHVWSKVSHPFRAVTTSGRRLFVKVLDPDPRSTDWLIRASRVFASRERRDITAMANLRAAADHEAAVTLAAHNAGVRVPEVVVARGDGAAAVVVLEQVDGHDLAALPTGALTDRVLGEVWEQVASLHRAGIAHRDLVRGNVMLDSDGLVWLVDFPDAEVGASPGTRDADVAELVASLAVAVGPARAVASAVGVLGPAALDRALRGLEHFALSPRTREELKARPGLLAGVRAAAGGGPDATADLLVVRRIWVPALLAVAGYAVLFGIAGFPAVGDVLADLGGRWVAAAGLAFATAPLLLGYAVRLSAAARLAIGRSAAACAVADSVEVLGGPDARRVQLRNYVRSCGASHADADAATDLVMAAEAVGAVLILAAGLATGWWRGDLDGDASSSTGLLLAAAVVAAAAGWLTRRRWQPSAVSRWTGLRRALSRARVEPGRAAAVLAAVSAAELAVVVALGFALRSTGAGVPFAVVTVALAGTRLLMLLLRVAGLPVVVEAACAGVLCALGVPAAPAVVGVVVYAVFRYWVTGAVSAVVAPRLAAVHLTAGAGHRG